MNILLINPPNCGRSIPEERYGITSIKQIFRGEPLALETLAGNLPGHEVRIVDLKARPDALDDELRGFTPDLIGFTAVTCEANWVRSQAPRLKAECGATLVVGGIHASNDPEFFNAPGIDYVVLGLGKQSLRELVEAIATGADTTTIPGIARTTPGRPLRRRPLRRRPRAYSRADLVEERPPATTWSPPSATATPSPPSAFPSALSARPSAAPTTAPSAASPGSPAAVT